MFTIESSKKLRLSSAVELSILFTFVLQSATYDL